MASPLPFTSGSSSLSAIRRIAERAGMPIEPMGRSGSGLTVRDVFDALVGQPARHDFFERVASASALPVPLREHLLARPR